MSGKKVYYAEFDTARAVLMTLGVLNHSAYPYVDGDWLIDGLNYSYTLLLLTDLTYLFHRPSFFVVAGFLCAMGFLRGSAWSMVRSRGERILLPLLVAGATLCLIQALFVYWWYGDQSLFELIQGGALRQIWDRGDWVAHLWFLFYLVIYVWAHALFLTLLRPTGLWSGLSRLFDTILAWRFAPVLVLVAAPMVFFSIPVAARLFPIIYEPLYGGMSFTSFINYGIFYTVGVICFHHRNLLKIIKPDTGIKLAILILAIVLAIGLKRDPGGLTGAISTYMHGLSGLLFAGIIVMFFQWLTPKQTPASRYLGDSSYTIYLFHHPIVVVLSALMLGFSFAPELKFLIVMVTSAVLSLAIYDLIVLRATWFRWMYNGTRKPGPTPYIQFSQRKQASA